MSTNPNCYFATIDPDNPAAAIAGTLLPEQGGADKASRLEQVRRVGLCRVAACNLTRVALGAYILTGEAEELLEQVPREDCAARDIPEARK